MSRSGVQVPPGPQNNLSTFEQDNIYILITINKMEDGEPNKQNKDSDSVPLLGNVLQSSRVRCALEVSNGCDWKLLVYNFYFLPIIGGLLYILLYVI